MHANVAIGSAHFLYHGGLAQMVERALHARGSGIDARILHKKLFP